MATMDWSAQAGSGPATYESFLVPAMFAPFATRLVQEAGVRSGSVVLDVACGTGIVSRTAARVAGSSGSVTGVDLGEPTLEIARSQPAQAAAATITYVQADAAALPLADGAFDVGLCQQGLQFFPNRAGALAEMRRTLKRDAPVAIATWKDIERSPFMVLAEALTTHLGKDAGDMMRSPFALSDAAELGGLVSDAGFRDVSVTAVRIDCTWSSHVDFARLALAAGPIAQVFAGAPGEAQRAVAEEVATRLSPYATTDGGLRMPMTTNVAVGRA